jgi:hypothetical protein
MGDITALAALSRELSDLVLNPLAEVTAGPAVRSFTPGAAMQMSSGTDGKSGLLSVTDFDFLAMVLSLLIFSFS